MNSNDYLQLLASGETFRHCTQGADGFLPVLEVVNDAYPVALRNKFNTAGEAPHTGNLGPYLVELASPFRLP